MTESNDITTSLRDADMSRRELRDLVRKQLQMLLEEGDLRGAKAILVPVQPVDIAEAIEGLPEAMHGLAFLCFTFLCFCLHIHHTACQISIRLKSKADRPHHSDLYIPLPCVALHCSASHFLAHGFALH